MFKAKFWPKPPAGELIFLAKIFFGHPSYNNYLAKILTPPPMPDSESAQNWYFFSIFEINTFLRVQNASLNYMTLCDFDDF